MEKVRPWCGQPSDPGRLRNRTALPEDQLEAFCTSVPHHAVVPCDGTAFLFTFPSRRRTDYNGKTERRTKLDKTDKIKRGLGLEKYCRLHCSTVLLNVIPRFTAVLLSCCQTEVCSRSKCWSLIYCIGESYSHIAHRICNKNSVILSVITYCIWYTVTRQRFIDVFLPLTQAYSGIFIYSTRLKISCH